jgi:hypothetical protein
VGEPAPPFLTLAIAKRFEKTTAKLQEAQCKQLARQSRLLFENPAHPSLKAHQIKPDKFYWEAYLNDSDRIVYLPQGSHLVLVDVVPHDDIGRYGKRPKKK